MVGRPKFTIGQVVHHKLFDYRGFVVDIDPTFSLREQWYEQVARSRPPKDAPWYRVLVDGAAHGTYVAEQNLEEDDSGAPIEHPLLGAFFDSFENGHADHRQTGVASASSTQTRARSPISAEMGCPGSMSPVETTSRGTGKATDTQKRRVMSRSSGFDWPFSSLTVFGSSPMPHIGQLPGASRATSGCIGHTHC